MCELCEICFNIMISLSDRRTHASRVLGVSRGSKPRPRASQSTVQSNMPLSSMGVNSVSGSITNSTPASENGIQLPRVELNSVEGNHIEQFSTTIGSSGHHTWHFSSRKHIAPDWFSLPTGIDWYVVCDHTLCADWILWKLNLWH